MPNPDLYIYLDASNDVLLERIARRGRPYETHIDPAYLNRLRASYDSYLGPGAKLRVFRFDTSDLDLESHTQMRELFASIYDAGTEAE